MDIGPSDRVDDAVTRYCYGSRVFSTFRDTFPSLLPFFIQDDLKVNHLAHEKIWHACCFRIQRWRESDKVICTAAALASRWSCLCPSEVLAISLFVDRLMLLIKKCRCVPGNETDLEIALREALTNAVISWKS